ncbi:MAG: carboxypeptidase-like regulatory domain-containing protein, partial [Bacteroidota bacterium]
LGLVPLAACPAVQSPPEAGTVTGAVTDAETGDAVIGATVAVEGTRLGAATDLDGRFEIRDVPAGVQRLRVVLVGYESALVDVTVAEGERTTVEIELSSDLTGVDEVVVRDEDRAPRPREAPSGRMVSERSASGAPSPSPASPRMSGDAEMDITGIKSGDVVRPPRWDPDPRPGLLTAGDVDDHLNFDAFLGWLGRSQSAQEPQRLLADLDLRDRVTVRIVDRSGEPVANARVRVMAEGGNRARGLETQAGTDGRLELFPTYDFGSGVRELRLSVTVPGSQEAQESIRLSRLGRDRDVRIQTRGDAPRRTDQMDIALAIDVTGSMTDELRYLTTEIRAIVRRIETRYDGVDLRFGLVAYRDRGDAFVVKDWAFTRDVQTMESQLASLRASGGGDYPEAMDQALEAALDLDWRPSATRLLFLVADAPPHDGHIATTMDHVREARASGIRIYPLAASGVGDTAELVMRTAAALTQGRHLFLTDDSGVGNTHQEPKVECFVVTRLNDLLVRVIASELEGRRVEPTRSEVIREIGDYDAGVCERRPLAIQDPRPEPQPESHRGGLTESAYTSGAAFRL